MRKIHLLEFGWNAFSCRRVELNLRKWILHRIESVMVVKNAETKHKYQGKQFLEFETLTMVKFYPRACLRLSSLFASWLSRTRFRSSSKCWTWACWQKRNCCGFTFIFFLLFNTCSQAFRYQAEQLPLRLPSQSRPAIERARLGWCFAGFLFNPQPSMRPFGHLTSIFLFLVARESNTASCHWLNCN